MTWKWISDDDLMMFEFFGAYRREEILVETYKKKELPFISRTEFYSYRPIKENMSGFRANNKNVIDYESSIKKGDIIDRLIVYSIKNVSYVYFLQWSAEKNGTPALTDENSIKFLYVCRYQEPIWLKIIEDHEKGLTSEQLWEEYCDKKI